MKYILAGSGEQFKDYARKHKLRPEIDCVYLYSRERVMGLYDIEIIRTGTWWLNPAAEEISRLVDFGRLRWAD